jgi:hypothetical protein
VRVDATEAAGVHKFNLTNLTGAVSNEYLQYVVVITDPTNFYWRNRTSENDSLGNITGGSTTEVFNDAFVTSLNSTSLIGTATGATYTLPAGLSTIYVQTTITNVGGLNQIQNVTFDLTQTNAIPEVTSSFALLAMLSSGLLLRRRTKS